MERLPPRRRDEYRRFTSERPRWNDIDVFGHVNNAEFYAYFDTVVLRFLHEIGATSARDGHATLVAESGARFYREVRFTDLMQVGLRVGHLGNSSVRYEIGVFLGDAQDAVVEGFFAHVFTDRVTRRPMRIPNDVRAEMERLLPAREVH